MKKLLSIGKFADLCETTVDTLIHYGKINLLVPSYHSGTKHRYYEIGLYHTFYIIHTLSKMGMSLQEMKEILTSDTSSHIINALKQKEMQLQLQLQQAQKIRCYFEDSLIKELCASHIAWECPFIQKQDTQQLLFATLPEYYPLSSANIIQALATHKNECHSRDIYPFPIGLMLQKKSLYAQNNRQVLLYSPNPTGTVTNKTPVQLPGEYAVILHKGSFETINDSIELLYQFIEEQNAVVSSHTYINFYHNSLPDTAESFYLIKIRFCRI